MAGDDAEPGRAVTPAPRADQSCVRFLGPQSENQARELLETSSVYIATSRYEPFGLAPLEAALAGCAIVANDIASLREVWSDAALFFETNSRDALTGLLGHLVDNPDLIQSAARQAYQHARQHLSSFAMSDGYVRLYRTLAGAGGRAR